MWMGGIPRALCKSSVSDSLRPHHHTSYLEFWVHPSSFLFLEFWVHPNSFFPSRFGFTKLACFLPELSGSLLIFLSATLLFSQTSRRKFFLSISPIFGKATFGRSIQQPRRHVGASPVALVQVHSHDKSNFDSLDTTSRALSIFLRLLFPKLQAANSLIAD